MSPANIFHPRYVKKLNHCFRITRFFFNYFDHSSSEKHDECIIFFPHMQRRSWNLMKFGNTRIRLIIDRWIRLKMLNRSRHVILVDFVN